jgi:hypothetical protein
MKCRIQNFEFGVRNSRPPSRTTQNLVSMHSEFRIPNSEFAEALCD